MNLVPTYFQCYIFNCRDASKAVKELDGQKLNGNRIAVEHGKVLFWVQSSYKFFCIKISNFIPPPPLPG